MEIVYKQTLLSTLKKSRGIHKAQLCYVRLQNSFWTIIWKERQCKVWTTEEVDYSEHLF